MSNKVSILATMTREGFKSDIVLTSDYDMVARVASGFEQVRYVADADIDADGANGQNGRKMAYLYNDRGLDRLVNIGYPHSPSQYKEGLICTTLDGAEVRIFHHLNGIAYFASRTALRMPGKTDCNSPDTYVDSAFYPYIVVPPVIRQKTRGKVLGCQATVKNLLNGRTARMVVADIGPSTKDGELSIEAAVQLGIESSPLSGGIDGAHIEYIIDVGVPAIVLDGDGNEFQFMLQ